MVVSPDLILAYGPRAFLSLTGIVTLVTGVWHVDRTWDEKGSKAYERAKKDSSGGTVTIPTKDLDDAFPFPWAFLLGWAMFAISFLFPVDGSTAIVTSPSILAAVGCSLALGVIASVPMGEAVRNRNGPRKAMLGMLFLLFWILLTVASSLANGKTATMFCPIGAITIISSMKVLWKNRKMGDTWEQEGKPNPNPVVYNLGGPMFVTGWFLFWIGMAATDQAIAGLPIYLTTRAGLAFMCGCGMVPIVMMLDYAHDEGGEYVGFGTDGRYWGRFLETPIPFILAWTGFGVSSLLPYDFDTTTTRQWIILVNCILQGIDAGVLIQTALYEGDMARKNKWSLPFVIMFISLAINIGLHGGIPLVLGLSGAILIIAGQKTVFGDRKRGDYFMQNDGKPNPNPIVYSFGEPLFMTGWILISWGMSLPM